MSSYVLDAYAWIEYFDGSALGIKVKDILENPRHIFFTNIITIAELSSSFARKGHDFEQAKKIILSLSSIFTPDTAFAEEAGKLHARLKKTRKHIGLADIFVLFTAIQLNAKVVTGDQDFEGLDQVFYLKN